MTDLEVREQALNGRVQLLPRLCGSRRHPSAITVTRQARKAQTHIIVVALIAALVAASTTIIRSPPPPAGAAAAALAIPIAVILRKWIRRIDEMVV